MPASKPPLPMTKQRVSDESLANNLAKQLAAFTASKAPPLSETDLAKNVYYQAIQEAEQSHRAKQQALNERPAWWTNPENYLDDYDITDASPQEIMRAGAYIYASLPSHPNYKEHIQIAAADNFGADVPRDALLGMLQAALNKRGIRQLSRKQAEAVRIARYAKEHGMNAALCVSETMNVSVSAAYKILQRADAIDFAEEMSKNVTVSALGNRRVQLRVLPNDADVQRKRRSVRRCCIVCQVETGDGRMPLCRDCHQKYRVKGDFSDLLDMSPERLEQMIRFSNAQHRHNARYAVAVDRLSLDED